LLLDFAGAWWVGWCLSQLILFQSVAAAVHHTRDAQRVTRPGFLCTSKKIIQAFLGVFEKKTGEMCQNYKALPEAVWRSRPEGVLIMTNFGSIDSKLKTKMALYI
jgi:hypothetical protein